MPKNNKQEENKDSIISAEAVKVTKPTITNQLLLVALLAIIAFMTFKTCNHKQTVSSAANLLKAVQDTLRSERNELGQMESEITVLTAFNKEAVLELNTKDSLIQRLQLALRKEKKRVRTVIEHDVKTVYRDTGSVRVVKEFVDTSYKMADNCNCSLFKTWKDEWFEGSVFMSEDTAEISFTAINKFEYTVVEEPIGFLGFKGRKNVVKVKNLNPYTTTKDLRAFTLENKPKRWNVGFMAGVGVSSSFTGQNMALRPFVGFGIGYSLFSF